MGKKKLRFLIVPSFLVLATLLVTIPVLAASSTFLAKATQWYQSNCTANVAKANYVNCYAFDKVNEVDAALEALTTRVSNAEGSIGSLISRMTSAESRLTALESVPTPTPSPIATPTSQALKAFDANGVELGIFMQSIFDGYNIFNIFIPSIERYVRIYTAPYSGEVGPRTHVKFTTTNCTGTAYTSEITPTNIEILANQVIPISPGKYYALDLNEGRIHIVAHSSLQGPGLWCRTDANVGSFDVYPLIPVELPFTEPVAVPLHYKFQ